MRRGWEGSPAGAGDPSPEHVVTVTARVGGEAPAETVLLWSATGPLGRFTPTPMLDDGEHGDGAAGDGVWGAAIPAQPAGERVRYYVEARAGGEALVTVFHPTNTAAGASGYLVRSGEREGFAVRIDALEQGDPDGPADPQGEHDDWIRLRNASGEEIDLSGLHLSDDPESPRKWRFPDGTVVVPGGYLVVWADEDGGDGRGLHASFKLGRGETIMLVDRDDRANAVLDRAPVGERPASAIEPPGPRRQAF